MILRVSSLVLALLLGIAFASLVPQAPKAVRAIFGALPGMTWVNAQDSGHKPDPTGGHGHTENSHGGEGVLKLTAEQIAAAKIEVAQAGEGTLARILSIPGTIVQASDRIGRVAAKVVGTVAEMKKQLGDFVQQGEVVAILDSREVAEAKSSLLTAIANFDLQKTLFEREQSLAQSKVIPENQFLRTRATYIEGQLRVDVGRQKLLALGVPDSEITSLSRQSTSLQRYELRAPISGRIVERLVNLGAAVGGEGQPKELYGIADLARVWVELAVPPRDLPTVKEGQTVRITAGGMNERAQGRIVFKSPLLTPETRSARVVAEIDNPKGIWQPGTYVSADIVIDEVKAPIVVPKAAVQTVGTEKVVFVRTPDGFEKRDVMLGRSDQQDIEIVFGLFPGEEIAVSNSFVLKAELGKAEASHAH